jgi:hypothetical protein
MNKCKYNSTRYFLFCQYCIIRAMNILFKLRDNFKTQPDIWFFYGFLITFPLSIRKVITFYPVAGQFNEWTGIYLYLSDIFLFLTLIFWLIVILRNNKVTLSIDTVIIWLKRAVINLPPHQFTKHLNQRLNTKNYNTYGLSINKRVFWCGGLPLLLVLWSFLTILWSENQNITLFRSIKLLEFYFLYLYMVFRIVPRGTFLASALGITAILGLIQGIIGIWQFILQHSAGFFWLGESLISPEIPGVAKIIFDGEKYIRAYGLFPHSNILGGFLSISVLALLSLKIVFGNHSDVSNVPPQKKCSMWNILRGRRGTFVETGVKQLLAGKNFFWPAMTVLLVSLALTFSKSAILGLVIALVILRVYLGKNKSKVFHVKQFLRVLGLSAFMAFLVLFIIKLNLSTFLISSLKERFFVLDVSRGTIFTHWFAGAGAGQFIVELVRQTNSQLEIWQYQPIHNVFLLILAELGFVGIFIFALFIAKIVYYLVKKSVPCETLIEPIKQKLQPMGPSLFAAIIFIMFFDHYFWTIQQGQIMLWLVFGFLSGFQIQNQKLLSNSR